MEPFFFFFNCTVETVSVFLRIPVTVCGSMGLELTSMISAIEYDFLINPFDIFLPSSISYSRANEEASLDQVGRWNVLTRDWQCYLY
jgi:hypothetical protein